MKTAFAVTTDQVTVLKQWLLLEDNVHTIQAGQERQKDFSVHPYWWACRLCFGILAQDIEELSFDLAPTTLQSIVCALLLQAHPKWVDRSRGGLKREKGKGGGTMERNACKMGCKKYNLQPGARSKAAKHSQQGTPTQLTLSPLDTWPLSVAPFLLWYSLLWPKAWKRYRGG